MNKEMVRKNPTSCNPTGFLVILFLAVLSIADAFSAGPVAGIFKPLRVLVIIGDQWEDPASYMVDMPKPTGWYSGYADEPDVQGASDFHHLMVLLKSWGIPFDVIRLDQQYLDRYMFLDMQGNPRYGTVIWDVNASDRLMHADYGVVAEMVTGLGMGIIALSDRISQPEIQNVLGLNYIGSWESNEKMTLAGDHFITRGIVSPLSADSGADAHLKRQQVSLLKGTVAVLNQGSHVQASAREYPSGGRAVWIGSDYNNMFSFQGIRTLLRRAITWTTGYCLYKTWENDIIMIMDDPGGAQNAWLEHWHYPPLSEKMVEEYLIRPLQDNHAVLNINFIPGFVNDGKKRLEPTWSQDFTDIFGTRHDNISGKKGYDRGVSLGVFEVMCHGLTHMQPDLVSDPVWFGTAPDQERSEVGWYREFGDTRRLDEIPAAEQRWRMLTAKNWLTEQFGVVPLEFCPGGLGSSESYFNNTTKLAAQAGFGWCGWETGYLGEDLVISGWKFFGTPESPRFVGVLPDGHDFGISREPEKFAEIFKKYPGGRFISINTFIGYLHAASKSDWSVKEEKLTIRLDYDPHYCRDFSKRPTTWNLEIADWLIQELGSPSGVSVDGNKTDRAGREIHIPAGTGSHTIEIRF